MRTVQRALNVCEPRLRVRRNIRRMIAWPKCEIFPTSCGTTKTMQEQIFHHQFENGLTLVAQPMPWLESAAFSIAVPAGCRFDPDDKLGLANFVCEMVHAGPVPYNSREFVEALESLGVDYSSSASLYNTNFSGAMQAAQLHDATRRVFADFLRRPRFPLRSTRRRPVGLFSGDRSLKR